MLIASSGGHLTELHLLRPRIAGLDEVVWVTFDTPQSRSLLARQKVHFVDPVPPRDGLGAVRALSSAWRLLRQEDPDVVVSTGAAIAVPFLGVAGLSRRSLYVESAARSRGPSVTGRIVRRLPRVAVYGQDPRLPAAWPFAGSVFESFRLQEQSQSALTRPPSVVVALGTMRFDFTRLVRGLVAALPTDARVLWQHGHTPPPPDRPDDEAAEFLSQEDLRTRMSAADVVVTHAGVGSVLEAMLAGHRPIVVPRLRRFGEHVDDHQVETAEALAATGLATLRAPDQLSPTDFLQRSRVALRADAPLLDIRVSPPGDRVR